MKNPDFAEAKPTPLQLFVIGTALLLGSVFFYLLFDTSSKSYARYEALSLAGRVDSILAYSRGDPLVRLSSGENELISMPAAGREYLQVGDSLIKKSNSYTITVYRNLPVYTEVSVFGGDSTDEKGLAKRYRINKP